MPPLRLALLAPLLLLGACGGGEEAAPDGLTADESAELNDAAAMLDADAVSANAVAPAKDQP